MSKKLYKYVGAEYLDKVIGLNDRVTLKCSRPKDFNDPYELFLTINFMEKPEVLAFYSDVIGELPQVPTTCFSRTPSVIPMWAHYAESLQGFAVEFDEKKLVQFFPKSGFGNVDYRDAPNDDLKDMLYRAYEIGKPRYLFFLNNGVFSAAYYTKAKCWSYEKERRMLVRESETRRLDDLILVDVPDECVTALICGPRSSPETVYALRSKAKRLGCKYFKLKIGKSSPIPFFLNLDGQAFIFNGKDIVPSPGVCESCNEPLTGKSKMCSWCRINDSHKIEAAQRNTFRMLHHYGLLDKYMSDMHEIKRRSRKN